MRNSGRDNHKQENLEREIESHLQMATQDRIDRGESPVQAAHSARREFGNVGLIENVTRDQWAWTWLEDLLQDLRHGARLLRRNPGFTLIAVLTLALGIGANTAIFSVLEGVVLDPLPYHQPDRLVVVLLFNRSLGYATYLSYPDFLDWQRNSRSFERIAAIANEGFDLTSPGAPEHVDGKEVSSSFFSTLGVRFALGQDLSPEEDEAGGTPAVVISHHLWHDRFGESPAAVGKNLTLNGVDHTIVGVLRPDFRFGDRQADVYTPIARRNPLYMSDRTVHDILCLSLIHI